MNNSNAFRQDRARTRKNDAPAKEGAKESKQANFTARSNGRLWQAGCRCYVNGFCKTCVAWSRLIRRVENRHAIVSGWAR